MVIRSFERGQGAIEPFDGIGLRWLRCDLHVTDMAASCATQRPVLEPGLRRRDPLDHGRSVAKSATGTGRVG
jgi:hypothetical protein